MSVRVAPGVTMLLASLALSSLLSGTALANPAYEEGVAALQVKDGRGALAAFDRCISGSASGSEVWLNCHWEAGWAGWLLGDWAGVVKHWEAVKIHQPDRDGLSKYLSQARDNLGLEALLIKGREGAVQTYKSDVPAGTTVRMRAVGDMMIGTDFPSGYLPADPQATFSDVKSWLADADVTFGNLEGPVCDTGKTTKCKPDAPAGSCYAFRTPESYAPVYKDAGFDVMSTANNHSGDFGPGCRERTEEILDELGIEHSGRVGDIARWETNGLKMAMVAFHTSRACHYVNDHETAAELVRALTTEADIVVVSFHGGAEGGKALHVPHGPEKFYGENRGNLREFTHVVIDAGADLVIGHGPHVLRGVEVYKDRLVAYSLGNFATYGRFNVRGNGGVGVVLDVTMDAEGKFVAGKLLPTKQVGEGTPMKDPEGKAIDLIRVLSAEDFPETGVKVAQDGTLAER